MSRVALSIFGHNSKNGIMTAATTRRKKISFYKDPYYPPGYSGYTPQLPFTFGDTFGTTTHKLLTDPNVAKSGRFILVDLEPKEEPIRRKRSEKEQWIRRRNRSWGDVKLNEGMVPGYTAYIPRSEEHFGARYAEICERSILDHNNLRTQYENKMQDIADSAKQPLRAIRREPERYIPLNPVPHPVPPYFADVDDPQKTFVSGYTAFVPKARSRYGEGYPILCNNALVSFTRDQNLVKSLEDTPVIVQRPPMTRVDPDRPDSDTQLYNCYGLLPNYTGYLPGHKFRYGLTYGASSRYHHSDTSFCKGRSFFKF